MAAQRDEARRRKEKEEEDEEEEGMAAVDFGRPTSLRNELTIVVLRQCSSATMTPRLAWFLVAVFSAATGAQGSHPSSQPLFSAFHPTVQVVGQCCLLGFDLFRVDHCSALFTEFGTCIFFPLLNGFSGLSNRFYRLLRSFYRYACML